MTGTFFFPNGVPALSVNSSNRALELCEGGVPMGPMLEGYDLKKIGLNSAKYIHIEAEAIKLTMADRDTYLGDTDFINVPYSRLLPKNMPASAAG
jgi:hypothetical protein